MTVYSILERPLSPHVNNADSFAIEIEPLDKRIYRSTVRKAYPGNLIVSCIKSNACVVKRSRDEPDGSPQPGKRRFSFIFVCEGKLVISHHLGTTELNEQDFILLSNTHPRTLYVYDEVSWIVINVPENLLKQFLPIPEAFAGRLMANTESDNGALFASITSLWGQIEKGLLDDFAAEVSTRLMTKLSQRYSNACRKEKITYNKRITQIKELIEENLDNPDLTVEMLAGNMQVSSRYLRGLFADSEKISHYILRRRLEECANQFSNVLYRNLSITAIAFEWGFNSSAHFSRAFKEHYGMSPREFRRERLEGKGETPRPATANSR